MAKKIKQLQKLFANPAPKDFTWQELLTVMHAAGYSESCSGGSHYMFEHTNGQRFRMSKTHPSGLLKRYQVEAAQDALILVGAWNKGMSNE